MERVEQVEQEAEEENPSEEVGTNVSDSPLTCLSTNGIIFSVFNAKENSKKDKYRKNNQNVDGSR